MTTARLRFAAAVLCTTLGVAAAADVPITGKMVRVGAATATKRTLAFVSATQTAIAAPFPDPTAGATLRVFVSSGPGQCHADVALPGGFWTPIGGDGAQKGWRYRDQSASAQGIRAVTIASRKGAGKITIRGRGAFPCALETAQAAPLAVELRVAATRWCASFGGSVRTNTAGHYRAVDAAAPPACLDDDVTVASLNVLHGIFCPSGTSGCRRADRMALVRDFVVARGCPDVLAFQEVFDLSATNENAETLAALLTNACPAPYVHAYHDANPFDDELVFSRYPLLVDEILDLLGPLRNVLHVRIDHPIGPVDVYATHLASGSDSASSPCAGTFGPCPAECVAASASTVRECQAVQMALHIEATHDVPTLALAVGDFNSGPGSFEYQQLASRGWTDTYLAAGNPECVAATGVGCTSGRIDEALTDIEDPALNEAERIDYVWLIPAAPASLCAGTTESAGDPDGDGVATRLFADAPNPFAACGPSPAAVCWGSDHSGVQADVNCP
jgi:endonuclease/exonuclease/phosphatase family metal-dependent hydrolase